MFFREQTERRLAWRMIDQGELPATVGILSRWDQDFVVDGNSYPACVAARSVHNRLDAGPRRRIAQNQRVIVSVGCALLLVFHAGVDWNHDALNATYFEVAGVRRILHQGLVPLFALGLNDFASSRATIIQPRHFRIVEYVDAVAIQWYVVLAT